MSRNPGLSAVMSWAQSSDQVPTRPKAAIAAAELAARAGVPPAASNARASKSRMLATLFPYQNGERGWRLLSSAPHGGRALMSGCIVGWAHTKFGRHEGRDVESLI